MNGVLSKIRSLHTYVMHWMFYFEQYYIYYSWKKMQSLNFLLNILNHYLLAYYMWVPPALWVITQQTSTASMTEESYVS